MCYQNFFLSTFFSEQNNLYLVHSLCYVVCGGHLSTCDLQAAISMYRELLWDVPVLGVSRDLSILGVKWDLSIYGHVCIWKCSHSNSTIYTRSTCICARCPVMHVLKSNDLLRVLVIISPALSPALWGTKLMAVSLVALFLQVSSDVHRQILHS